MPFQFTQCCAVLQVQQQQAEIEAKRLRVKYETLEKSYDNLKRTRRKKGKAQAQAMVEAAEAQVSNLERHLTEIQAELDETRKSAAEFNAERSKAVTDLQNAKSHLERKFAGLQVLFQCLIICLCINGAIVQCQQSTIGDVYTGLLLMQSVQTVVMMLTEYLHRSTGTKSSIIILVCDKSPCTLL
jgi:DNA repair exonuclease SbcCD ATPase subunit